LHVNPFAYPIDLASITSLNGQLCHLLMLAI
jgi:hypothetical protein